MPAATIIGHESCREEVIAPGTSPLGCSPASTGAARGRTAVRLLRRAPGRVRRRPQGRARVRRPRAHDERRRRLAARSTGCSSPATSSSTGARRSSSWGRSPVRWPPSNGFAPARPDVIVPGHGAGVRTVDAIDDQVAYLRFVQEVARRGFRRRRLPHSSWRSATDLGRFGELHDPERLVGNLYRAYSELRGEPLGASDRPSRPSPT